MKGYAIARDTCRG